MTKRKTAISAQEQQESLSVEQTCKVVQGTFKRKIEAVTAAAGARKKGLPVRLIIEHGEYGIQFAEDLSRVEAAEVIKNLGAVGVKAEIV